MKANILNDFDDNTLITKTEEKPKNSEIKSYVLVALSCISFGLVSFHCKLTKHYFPKEFDPICFMIFRSMFIGLIGYFLCNKYNLEIVKYENIQNKFWFIMRTVGNYFSFLTLIMTMMYFRVSTASCINSMFPAVTIIFSIFILGDKFYIRYVYGLVICFVGTCFILLNERTDHVADLKVKSDSENFLRILYGSFYGLANIIVVGMLSISMKIVMSEKINVHVQSYWVGLTNTICGCIHLIFMGSFKVSFWYFWFAFSNGGVYYLANAILTEGYKNIEITKTLPLVYLSTLTIFIMGVIFLGEPVFLTDFLGSMLILSYNVYNAFNPPDKKE